MPLARNPVMFVTEVGEYVRARAVSLEARFVLYLVEAAVPYCPVKPW